MGMIKRFYKSPGLSGSSTEVLTNKIKTSAGRDDVSILHTEICFNVQVDSNALSEQDVSVLSWILCTPFQENLFTTVSQIGETGNKIIVEIGPRLNFSTPFSTNAVSICHSVGLKQVKRIEFSTRYLISTSNDQALTSDEIQIIVNSLHDRMTHCRYFHPIQNFELKDKSDSVYEVDVMQRGRAALEEVNKELGLAFDDWDLDYYTNLFLKRVQRNPTSVECFDLAQSNSEHSRHWFFKGRLTVDGVQHDKSLFSLVMDTQYHSNPNNIIKFNDNSSGIVGHTVKALVPEIPFEPSKIQAKENRSRHIIFTAETHNFPTGVAPFPGATTGTGGRIRDVHATGRGAHVLAATAGYMFGNLSIPGYHQPWEDELKYPSNFASPLEIAVEASNGASDYGNKFGEPVLAGFARSFGQILTSGERREYIKPIMFSAGIGMLDGEHIIKAAPEIGMEVVKIGGPVYRIGVGGGAASSVKVQGDNKSDLDFGAVQRGDAEMEQKLNRLIRGCIEMSSANPIQSIHDQGAGGNGNVLKEITEPVGATIRVDDFQLGDPTVSILEIWGAEYQESDAILVKKTDTHILRQLSHRERCPVSFVGTVDGSGRIKLEGFKTEQDNNTPTRLPYDLDLDHVLGKMPRKDFVLDHIEPILQDINIPDNVTVLNALKRVLRLPSVGSKRYLTNKVDRSVTGLVAQQQCVGPLHTPLADVAVTASSYFGKVGAATAIGEQPIKGLVNAAAGARMSVAEAITNLMFARVTDLRDVKCSGNWMWPAKLPGEGAALYTACKAMCDVMKVLGVAVDGGKDSLSMAARVNNETVKTPGTLVISVYAACPDITATVTPDLKLPGNKGCLLFVKLSGDNHRLGGTALAQCYKQIGNTSPDLDNPQELVHAFNVTQSLLKDRLLIAGHDVSDGGIITCLLEMAFSGNCGIDVNIPVSNKNESKIAVLFAEEVGFILETSPENVNEVIKCYAAVQISCTKIGYSTPNNMVKIGINGDKVLDESMPDLRDIWEETSFQLERFQCNPKCVEEEKSGLHHRHTPPYYLPFQPDLLDTDINFTPKIAIIREEGSNGDREMAAAFHMAGFQVWDVNMQDLCDKKISFDSFKGIAFVGGFSYADVCGSAKGWAATAKFNTSIQEEFLRFYLRKDTFSLGVCNGCQLMALLGWVGNFDGDTTTQNLLLDHNESGRYESRFVTVKVEKSPAIMLQDMVDTTFGMWVSHGEGKMHFKTTAVQEKIVNNNLAPVRYVDDDGQITQAYPLNPNGSPYGIAAICSNDGRHLAIMPHPERCFLAWQCPWIPYEMRKGIEYTPWLKMFQNAFTWCLTQK